MPKIEVSATPTPDFTGPTLLGRTPLAIKSRTENRHGRRQKSGKFLRIPPLGLEDTAREALPIQWSRTDGARAYLLPLSNWTLSDSAQTEPRDEPTRKLIISFHDVDPEFGQRESPGLVSL